MTLKSKRTPAGILIAMFLALLIVDIEMSDSFEQIATVISGIGGLFSQISGELSGLPWKKDSKPTGGISDFDELESTVNKEKETPPGYAVPALINIDLLLGFTILMIALPIAVNAKLIANAQGFMSLFVGVSVLTSTLFLMLKVIANLGETYWP